VIVTGPRDRFGPWREALDSAWLPTTLVLFIHSDLEPLPPPLAKPVEDEVNAYVCEGATCLAPIRSPQQLRRELALDTMPPAPKPSLASRSLA
jgi:uncharacterized protein YyaL (SSP411 family)